MLDRLRRDRLERADHGHEAGPYKVLEDTVDAAEDAAEVIERIAAKHQ